MLKTGVLPPGDPGVFKTFLLPDIARALEEGEPVTAFGLAEDQLAVGALAGYLEGGLFQIASLYVAPDYRRRGGGRLLLKTLEKLLEDIHTGMIIHFTATAKEHETLFPFLKAMGFWDETDEKENIYVTTVGELGKTSYFSGAKETGTSFDQLDEALIRHAELKARENGSPRPEGGIDSPKVERRISMAIVRDQRVAAYAVFDRSCLNSLTLSSTWSGSAGPTAVYSMIRAAFARAQRIFPPEEKIVIQSVDQTTASLIQTMAPNAKMISHTWMKGYSYI
ncbi:MAG: GNAT family N-acetyltransferase [Lachnospiraceae bacterium]|nr:GNAT family N-acetyltransferase [Lachnospiraceae bacterium]